MPVPSFIPLRSHVRGPHLQDPTRMASAVVRRWRGGAAPSNDAPAAAVRPRPRAEILESRLLLAAGPAALVADINASTNPGLHGDDPARWGPGVFALNGTVVYRANDGDHGLEWWGTRTAPDGSPAGAVMLRDIYPGAASPFTFAALEGRPGRRVGVAGGTLYFSANDGVSGHELWATDGTPAGTRLVADLRPGPGASLPRHFVAAAGNVVYFTADGDAGPRLYRSDGTAAGTYRMPDFPRSGYYGNEPIPLAPVGRAGALLVAAPPDPESGYELWTTDGTAANTRLVKDLNPGEFGSNPGFEVGSGTVHNGILRYDVVTRADGVAFFAATDAANDRRLWRSDGPTAGTFAVGAGAPALRQLT